MSTLAETEAKMSLTFEEIKAIFKKDNKKPATEFFINSEDQKMKEISGTIEEIKIYPEFEKFMIFFNEFDDDKKWVVDGQQGNTIFFLKGRGITPLKVIITLESQTEGHFLKGGKSRKSKRSRKSRKSKKSRKSGKSRKSYK
jgi:hypothetical protein